MRIYLTLVTTLVLACGSSPGEPDPTTLPDASLPVPDAPPPVRTEAVVRVLEAGLPRAGALVVFHTASGDPTEPVITDVEGVARGTLAPGSTISIGLVQPERPGAVATHGYRLITLHDAEPEDLVVELDRPAPSTTELGAVRLELHAPGVSFAQVHACPGREPEGITSDGARFPVDATCLDADGKLSLLAVGYDGMGKLVGHSLVRGVTLGETVDFAAPFVAPTEGVYGFSHAFAVGAEVAGTARSAHVVGGKLLVAHEGTMVMGPLPVAFGVGPVPEGQGVVDQMALEGTLELTPTALGRYSRTSLLRVAAPGAAATLDATTELLAGIAARTVVRPAPDQLVVSWFATPAGIPLAASDGGLVHTVWSRDGNLVYWTAVVAPGATSVAMPRLPEAMVAWRPTSRDSEAEQERVVFVDSSLLGPAEFRQHVETTYLLDRRSLVPRRLPAALILRLSDAGTLPSVMAR